MEAARSQPGGWSNWAGSRLGARKRRTHIPQGKTPALRRLGQRPPAPAAKAAPVAGAWRAHRRRTGMRPPPFRARPQTDQSAPATEANAERRPRSRRLEESWRARAEHAPGTRRAVGPNGVNREAAGVVLGQWQGMIVHPPTLRLTLSDAPGCALGRVIRTARRPPASLPPGCVRSALYGLGSRRLGCAPGPTTGKPLARPTLSRRRALRVRRSVCGED